MTYRGVNAGKRMVEIKTINKIMLQLTGNGPWPVITETMLQINQKSIKIHRADIIFQLKEMQYLYAPHEADCARHYFE